jgi:hypothetical protein
MMMGRVAAVVVDDTTRGQRSDDIYMVDFARADEAYFWWHGSCGDRLRSSLIQRR